MSEVVQPGETPITVIETNTGLPATGTSSATATVTVEQLQAQIDKMQAALKDANRDDAKRRRRIEELEAADKQRAEAAMTEAQKLQMKLAELEPRAQKALDYEAVIADLLEARLKALIPEARKAVEDLPATDPLARLQWLAKNESIFTRQSAPRLDGGTGGGERSTDRPIQLSEAQLKAARAMNVNPEAYAKRLKELATRQAGA
jgi:uncharacterized phage infection (PIP) family protein YhgE